MKSPSVTANPLSNKSNPKPVLAIDIDEVLVPFMQSFFQFHNAKYGTKLKLTPDMDYHGVHREIGDTIEQFQRKIDSFVETESYRNGRPLAGAAQVIRRLKSRYELVVITARPESVRERTEQWVRVHFAETFAHVHFAELDQDNRLGKMGALRRTGASVLIDDNLSHLEEAAGEGIRGVLFGDYPWNQAVELPAGVMRVKDWREVERALL